MCAGTHCKKNSGRSDLLPTLSRFVGIETMEFTGPSNPGEFLQSQESSHGSPMFPFSGLLYQKQTHTQDLCTSFTCRIVWGSCLKHSRHVKHWGLQPAGSEQPWAGRPAGGGEILQFLFVLFGDKTCWAMQLGSCCGDPACKLKIFPFWQNSCHLLSGGEVKNGTHGLLCPGELTQLQLLEGTLGLPALSIWSLSLDYCQKLFIQCLVFSQSHCCLYTCVFDFVYWRSCSTFSFQDTTLICCHF